MNGIRDGVSVDEDCVSNYGTAQSTTYLCYCLGFRRGHFFLALFGESHQK